MTRRQKIFDQLAQDTADMYWQVDEFGRPKFTTQEVKERFGIKSNEGLYYRIKKASGEKRRGKHGLNSNTRKDLTSDDKSANNIDR